MLSDIYQMLHKSRHEVEENYEPDYLTYEKGIVDQGSEEIRDLAIKMSRLLMEKSFILKIIPQSNACL